MKICFICNEYPPGPHGGIGTMTQVLARALVKNGHEVRSIGIYPSWYDAPQSQNDHGVQVTRMPERKHPLGWIASRYQLFQQVKRWAEQGAIDVVELPDYQGLAAGWKALPVPVVARLHGSLAYFANELNRPIDKTTFWLERSSLRRVDFVSSVCRYTAEMTGRVFKLPMDSTEILYNPVETPAASAAAPRSSNRVIFSGTLTGKKGIVSLIKAWPLVVKSLPTAELHVFGKDGRSNDGGSMQSYLSAMLNGERPSVHFRGHVTRQELFDTYSTAAAAVFPSYAEAFAVAPLEAMAVGCPTICSSRGSGPELLTHEREGLLVDPDKPGEIAESILRVLRNPSFAAQIGDAARARVRDVFSIDHMVARNTAFYRRCVEQFRRKSKSPNGQFRENGNA
jgi:glycosyltransferase involved in cell wall biosynthesis